MGKSEGFVSQTLCGRWMQSATVAGPAEQQLDFRLDLLSGTVALAMATAVALCGAQAASSTPQTLASVGVRAPIGAYGGWVVWSTLVSWGWGLDAYHDGIVKALRVAPRTQPFDVDLGTNAAQLIPENAGLSPHASR